MLFKFQWQIEKHFLELRVEPGLVLMSPLNKIKELHRRRLKQTCKKVMILHDKTSRDEILHKNLSI